MVEHLEYPFRYVLREKADGSGVDDINSDIVNTGTSWRLDHLACIDKNGACDEIAIYIDGNGLEYFVTEQVSANADTLYWYNKPVYLEEGDWLIARFTGATLGDTLELHIMGVVLKPRRR